MTPLDNMICTYRVWIHPAGTTVAARKVEIAITIPRRLITDDATVNVLLQTRLVNNLCNPRLLSGQARAMVVLASDHIGLYDQSNWEYRRRFDKLSDECKLVAKGCAS